LATLNLGLLADTSIQLSNLESIVTNANFEVASTMLTRLENLDLLPEVDVWVVRLDLEDACSQAFAERLDGLDIPVIYDEADSCSSLNIEDRAKRFSRKIEACGLLPQNHDRDRHRAEQVWVLAASAGGPEAVIEFIKSLPAEVPEVAFVYVQHMDENMSDALAKSIRRNTDWQVFYCETPHIIYEKSVYLISPSNQIEFNDVGTLVPTKMSWVGPYRPSVDQVIAKVWRKYGRNSGVIVFSGMGDDGAKTCVMIKNAGGQVWVQSPESCAVDSMPREVINTQCVSYVGTPEQLARHFSVCQKVRMNPVEKRKSL